MSYQVEIPYGFYWSTPFAKWQGSFSNLNSIEFAAYVLKSELAKRRIARDSIEHCVLGLTVPQKHSFYGMPWLAGLAGLPRITGPTVMQACATGVRALATATCEVNAGISGGCLAITCDRTSNGPHIYYPSSAATGGTGAAEDWVLNSFACDPLGPHSMLRTAENVAAKHNISSAEQHDVVLCREAQYRQSSSDGYSFQKKYMTLPFAVPDPLFRKTVGTLQTDEGVRTSTAEGLAGLKSVLDGGTVTYGGQTYPADGNGAIMVATPEKATELSANPSVHVKIRGFGSARVDLAYMPEAPVPAAMNALKEADLSIDQIDVVKTHNPFAVNDIYFSRQTGFPLGRMNNFGCSLVWGHPQAPMGTRAIIELIEELALRGGGFGLFTGCAAGDSALAVVIEVNDRAKR